MLSQSGMHHSRELSEVDDCPPINTPPSGQNMLDIIDIVLLQIILWLAIVNNAKKIAYCNSYQYCRYTVNNAAPMLHHAMYVYPKAQSNKQYIHDNSRNRERTQDADHTPTDDNNEIQKGIDKSRTQNAKDIHPIQQCRTK